ncbi:MAG: hypothetical protein JWO40_553 [Candidatus Doudnabacteria bacterium]|nr:hypothetical protein [Candidatus Doudnabacteria bacterium]
MTAQHIFYILGSIAFGGFVILLIVFIAIMISINRQIRMLSYRFHLIADEIEGLIESGKSYGRYLGANVGVSVLGKILKMFRK